ncbi:hypothetical protein PAMP_002519 [Pampus punctatissimus]
MAAVWTCVEQTGRLMEQEVSVVGESQLTRVDVSRLVLQRLHALCGLLHWILAGWSPVCREPEEEEEETTSGTPFALTGAQ